MNIIQLTVASLKENILPTLVIYSITYPEIVAIIFLLVLKDPAVAAAVEERRSQQNATPEADAEQSVEDRFTANRQVSLFSFLSFDGFDGFRMNLM